MILHRGLLVVIAVALIVAQARAQGSAGENDDTRFTFHRTDDGYLRLDGRSGQVSVCAQKTPGWLCQTVPDERAALEAEIARLQTENAALKKELLAHDIALPPGVKPDAAAQSGEPRIGLPSDAELNQVMSFIEKVWKRFVELIVNTQKEITKRSSE